jgi:hypothetical protein
MVRTTAFVIVVVALVLLTSGCATLCDGYCEKLPPVVKTVKVKVPVLQCPTNHRSIVREERPVLAIESLTPLDINDPGKVAKAYKITIKQLQKYTTSLEDGFDAYRSMCVTAEGKVNEIK